MRQVVNQWVDKNNDFYHRSIKKSWLELNKIKHIIEQVD